MSNNMKTSILTNSQREWLNGEKQATHERQIRKRIYKRIRAAITTDAKIIADAIEEGRLDAGAIVRDIDFAEIGDGTSDLVTVLYLLCEAVETDMDGNTVTMDPEKTIEKGIVRGSEGRIRALEKKLNDQGVQTLTIGELMDLRNERPELTERINRQIDLDMSDLDTGMGAIDLESESETSNE